ncbi:MAG: 16S rRNA (guanine(966)-N(2))-methyltransferase RsmD [Solirubrobacteraceae bacterium]
MRVVAGIYGGRELVAPKGSATRPTSDRVREALFSILRDVSGARVLDLFAGSGALAIEAVSRGAAHATLVDSSRAAIAAIRRNLERLEIDATVHRGSALAFLEQAPGSRRQYDLVFLDPPYRHAGALSAQLTAALAPVLAPEARVVAESDRRGPLELGLELLDQRRYGDTLIQIHGSR